MPHTTVNRRRYWVLDYETICNTTVLVAEDLFSDRREIFAIWEGVDHFARLVRFLLECRDNKHWHLGYNILNFDAQISEYILDNIEYLSGMTASRKAEEIYSYAQRVIENSNSMDTKPDYPEYKLRIRAHDIYRMNNWDSNAKRTSLKWVQYSMDWLNVEEMPHPHDQPITTPGQLQQVVDYCINDVRSTKEAYLLKKWNKKSGKWEFEMLDQIDLRAELSKTYDLTLFSAPEPRISKEVFLHFLEKKLGKPKFKIRDLRTYRKTVDLGTLVLPEVKFYTPEFRQMMSWFKNQVIDTSVLEDPDKKKNKIKHTFYHKGVKSDFGLGGMHGCIRSGIYTKGNGKIIVSVDVESFYPNLAIKNKWSPAHLPKNEFCELYEWFFKERKKFPKGSALNYLFKIILNATYGLSKNKHSFLYDPEFTFRITVNGQLLLSMLYEMLTTRIPGSQPLMQNTDGMEFVIDEKDRFLFEEICHEWEKMTQLKLEFVEYERMIIGDVNNYIAIDVDGKTKCKGRFEYDNLPLHKNKSNLIIPKAIYHYFVEGIAPEDYLKSNRNIFDYCAGVKLRGDWRFEGWELAKEADQSLKSYTLIQKRDYLEKHGWQKSWDDDNWVRKDAKNKEANNGLGTETAFNWEVQKTAMFTKTKLQKMLRYYNSSQGVKLMKINNKDGRQIKLEATNTLQRVFNQFEEKPWEEYQVNEKYYLRRIKNEITKIELQLSNKAKEKNNNNKQLALF